MAHFQAVRSGLAISQSIADMLERADPTQYHGANRVQTIRETNDILQDRSELSLDMLYSLLAQTCGGEAGQVEKIRRDVEAFCVQKSNRARRYTLTGAQEYHYEMWDFDPKRPLKIISQPLFDHAAEHGFPPDFFTESYFDHVTIYCMPDNVDCSFSQFQSCQFSVCGIRGAVFDNATLDDTDFHSALLRMVNFTGASIAHSHFRDNFLGAVLDGSSYGRVAASGIQNLPSATITQGGATQEEAERLRASVFHELAVPILPVRQRPRPARQEKPSQPER